MTGALLAVAVEGEEPCPSAGDEARLRRLIRDVGGVEGYLRSVGLEGNLKTALRDFAPREFQPGADFSGPGFRQVPLRVKLKELDEREITRLMSPHYEAQPDAGILMVFRAPSSFSLRDCGRDQGTQSTTAANSMVHPKTLRRQDGASRYQEIDTIGRTVEFKLEKGDCEGSITVSARAYDMMGGANSDLTITPVSDATIERFHQARGFRDPYHRQALGFDHHRVHLVDDRGEAVSPVEGRTYLLSTRIKLDRYEKLTQSEDGRTTLNYGGQILLPGEKPFSQTGAGVHTNLQHTRALTDDYSATVGAGLGVNVMTHVFGGYRPYDGVSVQTYSAVAAGVTRRDADARGSTSVVIAYETRSALLEHQKYDEPGQERFLQRQSRAAATDKERGFVIALIRRRGPSTHSFHCREDVGKVGHRFDGTNVEDFKCGYSYSREF
ncbi:MAG: hypothetical protein IT288_11925 [Bdellovibrionales bacterium]|nr:hypothetical protein [Bdellovibrionales bacterium]